jgi:ethanolamine utilization protein EutQ
MLDRVFTAASIRPIFNPASVAVIGASRDHSSIGFRILHSLRMGYKGRLFAINRRAKQIDTIPSFASISEVSENVDLAIVCVPKESVLEILDDCAKKGVRALIVISAGFAETGKEGDKVLLKDVVTLKESPRLGCGLMEMKETRFDWTLKYDEIDYIIDGTLEVNIDGRKVVASKGEMLFIPKNSTIEFSVPEYAKFMYVTYPANWADLK